MQTIIFSVWCDVFRSISCKIRDSTDAKRNRKQKTSDKTMD